MSAMNDEFGNRMKRYELPTKFVLTPHTWTILRVDGRAFHTYLRQAEKPFDHQFIREMQFVGEALCSEVSGTVLAYGQSDEISLVLSDIEPQTEPWFGGVVQKMVSVAASAATLALVGVRGLTGSPMFDARVYTIPSSVEVANYLLWRQRDAVRNSVMMAAQAVFSASELNGVNTGQMQEMLWAQHKINWNDYSPTVKRGWVVKRHVRESELTYVRKGTAEEVTTTALRSSWEAEPADHFTVDGLLPMLGAWVS